MRLQPGDELLQVTFQVLLLLAWVDPFLSVTGEEELWCKMKAEQLMCFSPQPSFKQVVQLTCNRDTALLCMGPVFRPFAHDLHNQGDKQLKCVLQQQHKAVHIPAC